MSTSNLVNVLATDPSTPIIYICLKNQFYLDELARYNNTWHPSGSPNFGYVGVSKNRGTPKWMVYSRKPY